MTNVSWDRQLPTYVKELGYRASLFNKDGIRKPSDLYQWEFLFKESEQPLPGASDPPSRRHLMTRCDELEAILTADDPRPFCIHHASRLPHTPYLGKLPNGLEGYEASNFIMDVELVRNLQLLKKLGLTNSTVVVFVNDNEAAGPRTKYTLYDSGLIVPCIVRWTGHTQPVTTTDAMVSFIDFLPTLVHIAGGEPDPSWDGKSMVEVWEGNTDRHHDELYFSYTGVTLGKVYDKIPYPIRAFHTNRYKYIRNLNHSIGHPKQAGIMLPVEEFYDLETDPTEQKKLAEKAVFQEAKRQLLTAAQSMYPCPRRNSLPPA